MSSESAFPGAPAAAPPIDRSLWANLTVMWRVIFALIIRDSRTRYGHSDLGYLWALINPLLQTTVLVLVFTALGRRVPLNASLPVFFTMGILPYQFWHSSVSRGATAAGSNGPLLSYPQVKVLDVVISRVLLDFSTMILVFLIFIVALHYVTGEPFSSWFGDPLQMVLAFSSLIYFAFGSAVFSSGLARVFPAWHEVFGYLSRPLWFTSGIFFTLQGLSKGFQKWALINPVAHMMEWIKSAMLPSFHSDVYRPMFILTTATVLLFIGLTIEWLWRLTGHPDGVE